MKIELKKVTARELFEGFVNSDEEGVSGYGGKLNIRPKYQRNFVYSQAQQDAVIDTISRGYPLNVMYWVANADGTFEVLDGQQRTLSICAYMAGDFAVTWGGELRGYANLLPEQRAAIDGYELMVYVCSDGTDKEKLDWFKTINIAGVELTAQEIRNAVYCGPWVTAAKRKFSKTGCVAYSLGGAYMTGKPIRQDYLETAIDWHAQALGVKGNKAERIERHLRLRLFDENTRQEAYERQGGRCANPTCPKGRGHVFAIGEMEADHIVPWSKGGKTVAENCQMLCRECNRRKSDA